MSDHDIGDLVLAALWNAHRRRVLDLAVHMLSDVGEAEDVAQEAFVRLGRADVAELDDVEGWLVVVTARLCLDRLRARRRRPTHPLDAIGDRPDPRSPDPALQVALVDNVTLAMHALLERLSPAERTSFVLHDVFQHTFEEVASIVGRTPAACRQLASRARRTLQAESAAGRFPVDVALQRRLGERFVEVCAGGDLEGLLALLDPSVEGAGDVNGEVAVGADAVASGILRYLGPAASPLLLHLPVGDRVGIVAVHGRRVQALVLLQVEGELVVHVDALTGEAQRAAVSSVLGLQP